MVADLIGSIGSHMLVGTYHITLTQMIETSYHLLR
jgi:hypothetical protein